MEKIFLLLLFSFSFSISASSQMKKTKGSIGVSIPVIWNKSEATYYQLGSLKNPSGNAVSHGLNIHYSRNLYDEIYGNIGIGYYHQKFDIYRPLNYIQPDGSKPLVHTNEYLYNNVNLLLSLGYVKNVDKNWIIKSALTYNWFNSFSQKYFETEFQKWISNKRNMDLGQIVLIDVGMERYITKKIFLGADLLVPIITKWNNHKIFTNSFYSNKELQIAQNKFSIGISLSFYYYF